MGRNQWNRSKYNDPEYRRQAALRKQMQSGISDYYKGGDAFDAEGSFIATRFSNDEGFIIGTFAPKGGKEPIICKGNVPGYIQGVPFHITGTVIDDKKWGLQVKIKSAVTIKPTGKDQIISFLGSGAVPGIGPVTARAIYEHFGLETLDILEHTPQRLEEVPGIGAKTLARMIDTLPSVLAYREVIGYFSQFGISTRTINRLIDEYGAKAKETVQANPYILCKVRGFAFSRADQIAMKIGFSKDDPHRLYAGVLASLRHLCLKEGHTVVPRPMLLQYAMEKLGTGYEQKLTDALDRLVRDKVIIEDNLGVHLKHLYYAEKTIKSSIAAARNNDILIEPDELETFIEESSAALDAELTDEQIDAVRLAFGTKLSILSGGAGCGKTMIARTIVDIAKRAEIPVCLVSPTGRAAKHLSEVCDDTPGFTMHRALAIIVKEAEDEDFFADDTAATRNVENDAVATFNKADLVLADEASMMDTEMAALLFKACKDKHLVLIGDPNQLASVGPGRVLGDLIDSGAANLTKLTKIFRQAEGSPIISAANLVLQGKSPANVRGVKFIEAENADVQNAIEEHVIPIIQNEGLGYEDYMVISPIKNTPVSGVNALNKFLRPICNQHYKQPSDEKKDFLLQKGDFVMQKRNNYDVEIFNGDIGIVNSVAKDGTVFVSFSGGDCDVAFERDEVGENLMLAYASTVHKQQGSQSPLAIVICTSSQFALLKRNMLYTAITRAQERLILIGDRKAFAMAASNEKENKRMTGLK